LQHKESTNLYPTKDRRY